MPYTGVTSSYAARSGNRFRFMVGGLLALFLFVCSFSPVSAAAVEKPDVYHLPETYILLTEADDPDGSLNGIEKKAGEKAYPASIVKLLTALVAVERNQLTDTVTVSAHAVDLSRANTKAGIKKGEVYTLEDLLFGALLPSACDCARAIADLVAGGEDAFAVLMNEKAAELGMADSHFTNASGLHNEAQYTTCRDLVRLAAACAKNDTIVNILVTKDHVMTEQKSGRTIKVRNINRLIRDPVPADYKKIKCIYPYCIGGKTGSTIASGLTFISMAKRGDKTLVCVLLGDYRDYSNLSGSDYDAVIASRFQEAVDLFTYGFSCLFPEVTDEKLLSLGLRKDFSVDLLDREDTVSAHAVASGIGVSAELPEELLSDLSGIEAVITQEKTSLPVSAGERLGYVTYSYAGETLFTLPLTASSSIELSPEATAEPVISVATAVPVESAAPATVLSTPPSSAIPVKAPEKKGLSLLTVLAVILAVMLLATLLLFFILLRNTGKRKKRHRR